MDWQIGKLGCCLIWLLCCRHHMMFIHEKNRVHCVFMVLWELQTQISQLPLFDLLDTTYQFGLLISKAQSAKWAFVCWFRRLETWSGRTGSIFIKSRILSIILGVVSGWILCLFNMNCIWGFLWNKKLLLLLMLSYLLKLF
jgi:hypothetical protein